ncbi:MAG TPA: glycosyltransferase family 2 protein [Candidatus Angelobacter sp.]|jgi:GT2 family glycosyltransferase|nr:glycosyltransferase family 2 protein [Candidatus Angelobacter sp.]
MVRITIPATDAPALSVVLVTYNAWEWTERALHALTSTTDLPYELVVIDNASHDQTRDRLRDIDNARVVLEDVNRGFGVAANLGVIMSRAPRVLLLNSDALLQPGWLDPLAGILDSEDDVAAVGARLDHVDGSLQEAGSIIWGDGASDNYGDGDDPRRPEYRFRRDVDYLSAACLLVRRSAFCDAGGFDPVYHPAYYEDTDLAMRWRSMGMRVVYQPRSVAVHKRWASSGDRSGMVPQLLRNRPIFVERWRELLGMRPPRPEPEDGASLLAMRDAECVERLLLVTDRLDSSAGAMAAQCASALAGVARNWRVSLLCWDDDAESDAAEALRAQGIEVTGRGVDVAAWLSFRQHHHTAVLADAHLPARIALMVRDAQPHAWRAALLSGAIDGPAPWLAGAQLAVCNSETDAPDMSSVPAGDVAALVHRAGLRLA